MTARKKLLGPGVNFGSYVAVFGPPSDSSGGAGTSQFSSSLDRIYTLNYGIDDINALTLVKNDYKRAIITDTNNTDISPSFIGFGQSINQLKIDSSGNFHGYSMSYGAGYLYYYTVWNSSGTRIWSRAYGASDSEGPFSAARDADIGSSRSVFVVDGTVGSIRRSVVYSINNSDGSLNWRRLLYGSFNSYGVFNCIVQDSSGNVYVAGISSHNNPLPSYGSTPSNWYSTTVVKFNSSGTLQWRVLLDLGTGIEGGNLPEGIHCSNNGNDLYLCNDNRVVKLNASNGSLVWARQLGINARNVKFTTASNDSALLMLASTSSAGTPGTGPMGLYYYTMNSLDASGVTIRRIYTVGRRFSNNIASDVYDILAQDIKVTGGFVNFLFSGAAKDYLKNDYTPGVFVSDNKNNIILRVPIGSASTGEYLIPTTSGKFAKVVYTDQSNSPGSNGDLIFSSTSSGSYNATGLIVADPVATGDSYTYWLTTNHPFTNLQSSSPTTVYSSFKLRI